MADIKPLSTIVTKWGKKSSVAGPEYRDGVTSPRRSWATAAAAADENRKAGLARADERGAFVAGILKTGDVKWKNNSIKLGVPRYPQGVQNAQPEFSAGFAPYHAVIQGVTLSPGGPRGSPENLERVRQISTALHDAKQTA